MANLSSAIDHLLKAKRISAQSQSYRKDNPVEYTKVEAYLEGGPRPTNVVTEMGMGLVEVEDVRRAATPTLPAYTYRFATFDQVTDKVCGTLNAYRWPENAYWWDPLYPPPAGKDWPGGGGIFPIANGFSLVCDKDMLYWNSCGSGCQDSRVVRLFVDPKAARCPIAFQGKTHEWAWTWRRPSAGNPNGWYKDQLIEGLFFGTLSNGLSAPGGHFYLQNPSNGFFGYYAARQIRRSSPNQLPTDWERFYCPVPFNADEEHAIRWESFWTTGADGRMEAWTSINGGPEQKWCDYSGPTLPVGFQEVYGIGHDIRPPLGGNTQTLDVLNWRVTIS